MFERFEQLLEGFVNYNFANYFILQKYNITALCIQKKLRILNKHLKSYEFNSIEILYH